MHVHTYTLMHAHTHVWHAHTHLQSLACSWACKSPPPRHHLRTVFLQAGAHSSRSSKATLLLQRTALCRYRKTNQENSSCVCSAEGNADPTGESVGTLTVVRPSNVNDLICPFSKKTFRTLGMRRRASFFIIFCEQTRKVQREGLI